MNYITWIILILIVIDIYYRFRNQTKFNLLTKHIAFVINRYEKILLNKKVITEEDVRNTRNAIKNDLNEQDFLKLKKMVVVHDDTYLPILTDVIRNRKDYKSMLDTLEDTIYMADKQRLNKLENDVHKNNE